MNDNFNRQYTVSPLFSVFLLFLSLFLIVCTAPIGIMYGFIRQIRYKLFKGIGIYCLQLAITLDVFGNIAMQHLFNKFLIKHDGYKFGNNFETVSSVLGKNQLRNSLKPAGKTLIKILEHIESEHCLNSVKYLDKKFNF